MLMRSGKFRSLAKASLLAGVATAAVLVPTGFVQAADRGDNASKKSVPVSGKLAFTDLNGKTYGLQDLTGHKASVFLFVACQCPVSNVYTSRIVTLADTYGKKGVQVFAVYSSAQESVAEIKQHARERGLLCPVVKDVGNVLAARLGATMTPQAIVVDSKGAVCYRGRIDDNAVATRVTSHDLQSALDAVLDGKPVANPKTAVFGCVIRRVPKAIPADKSIPTYAGAVAGILRAKCERCHRSGEVAPFSLQTYQQAGAWAADIKKYTQNGQMPPWKPVPGYGEFKDAHAVCLTEAERMTLAKWVDAGAPLGDPKQTPPARQFPKGWQHGEPDVVITPAKEYRLAADGDDVYRNFIVKTNFPEDRYIKAVEIRPGNNAVVHHVVNFVDGLHGADRLEGQDKDGQIGYTSFGGPGFMPTGLLGVWAPGYDTDPLPDGVGARLPKGANIVIQVHYHKDGKPETDLTRVGLFFARGTVDKKIQDVFLLNPNIQIPPGEERYEAKATATVMADSHLLSIMPHMHLLGREMKLWVTLPEGTEKPLVWIKDWDFNWQASYTFKEPLALPKGSKIHLVAYYDNSSQNPRNPNKSKPRLVTFGEATTDEMCLAYYTLTRDDEHIAATTGGTPLQAASNTSH
jgi:hypothetical protein